MAVAFVQLFCAVLVDGQAGAPSRQLVRFPGSMQCVLVTDPVSFAVAPSASLVCRAFCCICICMYDHIDSFATFRRVTQHNFKEFSHDAASEQHVASWQFVVWGVAMCFVLGTIEYMIVRFVAILTSVKSCCSQRSESMACGVRVQCCFHLRRRLCMDKRFHRYAEASYINMLTSY